MVTVLQRDQTCFQGSQHRNRAADDERRPQNEMHPYRRRKLHLDESRKSYDDQTKEKNNENGWAVARVLCGEIKTADLARAADVQEAGK